MKIYFAQAFEFYQKAFSCLGTRDTMPDIWDSISYELSGAYFSMGSLMQDHAPLESVSHEEVWIYMVIYSGCFPSPDFYLKRPLSNQIKISHISIEVIIVLQRTIKFTKYKSLSVKNFLSKHSIILRLSFIEYCAKKCSFYCECFVEIILL